DPDFSVDLSHAYPDDLENFVVSYTRNQGEDIGLYDINASVSNPNYTVSVISGTLTINQLQIHAQLLNQSQVYGDAAVDLTFELDLENYRDELELVVSREAGDIVGDYTINA